MIVQENIIIYQYNINYSLLVLIRIGGGQRMKFIDGNWLIREGYHIINPVEVQDVFSKDNALTIYGTPRHVVDRSNLLDTPLLTVQLFSPIKDVIGVRITHHKGINKKGPEFEIKFDPTLEVEVINNEKEARLVSGSLSVSVKKGDQWSLDVFNGEERITGSSYKGMGYVKGPDETTYVKEQLDLDVGEYVYGLGERFTPFVKNGQVVDIWNKDGGTATEQAYKNIPFYLTNKGYGVFVNHPELVSFEVASERVSKVQFSVSGESLEYFIINGPSMKDVLERYTQLTGKPALPPAWTFGLWLTTSFTTNYDEETVNKFVNGMAERDLPLHVFHFDCFWMKEFEWCNFEWDERVFPDPVNMLKRLKEKGLKICVWINPYIAQRSKLFDEGVEQGYLLKKANGNVWQWDLWQPGMGIVDFTNPAACEWYADKLRALVDMGVDSFKTDFGERIPTDVVYYDGSDPMKMHNYYTQLYNKVVFEVLEEELGKGEAALFARSATAGGQQFPVHWGGDCYAFYESMAESLRGGLSLGLSGFGFWSHDIGGFENTATSDVFKRWVAFGLLSSHSRLHGSKSYRVPWAYDEEAVDVTRFFTKLKCRLMPYIFRASNEATTKGFPVMRAMVLEFPEDPNSETLDRQYMLGESLLVAPIFNDRGMSAFYLPFGKWTDFLTGEVVEGGRWIKKHYNYMSIPLFVRPNSIIAIGHNDLKPDYDYEDQVTFHLFELEEGKEASTAVFNIKGETAVKIAAIRENNEIEIVTKGVSKPWSLLLRGIHEVNEVTNADFSSQPDGIRIVPTHGSTAIKIKLK
jgi:alpha-D-xyloside xylohydrolase